MIQKRLIRAGYRQAGAVRLFYGFKVVTPLLLVVVATLTGAYEYGAFFVYTLAVALGFLLPDFVLGNRIHNRQLNIRLGLPDALDVMVICVEAGMGLDQTIQRVAEELRISRPEISDELSVINLEQRAGRAAGGGLEEPGGAHGRGRGAGSGGHAGAGGSVRHQRR